MSPKRLIIELASTAISRRFLSERSQKNDKPGAMIQKLSQKERDILTNLTSDDIKGCHLGDAKFVAMGDADLREKHRSYSWKCQK